MTQPWEPQDHQGRPGQDTADSFVLSGDNKAVKVI